VGWVQRRICLKVRRATKGEVFMRFVAFRDHTGTGLAVSVGGNRYSGLRSTDARFPGFLEVLAALDAPRLRGAHDALAGGEPVDLSAVTLLPPLSRPDKIICIGLNYADHSAESGFKQPDYPTLFARFSSSLIGHGASLIRPKASSQLDYEGELVAVIGKGGRNIHRDQALSQVFGYSIFNDASVRDYQFKSPQWTMGKNFDGTGAFGPTLVTPDELPPGCRGLKLETRLNGQVVQKANIDEMVFDVA